VTSWLALSVELDGAAAEAFSDALLEAGAQSVAVESPDAARPRVIALVALEEDSTILVARASRAAGIAPPRFSIEKLADEDWVRASQAQFVPSAIGERLWIGPSWHEAPPARMAVRIDPGLAFGTGSHPTTKLALSFLEKNIRGGERVLDYGCGSGILGIAAARLGAGRVDAVDLDPQAVDATRANALANGVVLSAALPDALPAALYDLVVSNILAQPLIALAPLFAGRSPRIALSGVLEEQAEEVMRAYEPWFEMSITDSDEGWALLCGTKR
jgi:ribosomal protein L11 methyltransferase